jgi:hypothetical protein
VLGTPSDWLKHQLKGDRYEIDLRGLDVRLRGTKGGWTRRTASFMSSVPSMREIAPKCGKMRPEARDREQVDGELVSFFDYRGGTLTPRTYLKKKLAFKDTSWKGGRCAVCEVEYSGELDSDEAWLDIEGTNVAGKPVEETIRIAADSELSVSNLPPDDNKDHFHHHYEIFSSCESDNADVTEDLCQKPECTIATSVVIRGKDGVPGEDCTNSQWP